MRTRDRTRLLSIVGLLMVVMLGHGDVLAHRPEDVYWRSPPSSGIGSRLGEIVEAMPAISHETQIRRRMAHMTFCLPQNVLGILFYALLEITGNVLGNCQMNEAEIVVCGLPVGASLGRYLFLPASCLTEQAVRHEYGHTLQGYRHGPFYLLLEGTASFVQAAVSMISPTYAAGYFDRWPENEANELGGIDLEAIADPQWQWCAPRPIDP